MEDTQYERHYRLSKKHWWYIATNHLFYEFINKYVQKKGSILDVGCGAGGMLNLLKPDYPFVTGIDNERKALKYCKLNGIDNAIQGEVESLPFAEGTFHGIISLDVLYHEGVKNDVIALKEIARVLKPDGYVFIQLPAYEWMRSSHDRIAHSFRRYTKRRLKEMLISCDLRVERITYRVCILFILAFIQRKLLRNQDSDMRETNGILNALFIMSMRFEEFLLKKINLPFGLSVIAIAQKR